MQTRKCALNASHTQERPIPVTGHVHDDSRHVDAKPATCTVDGNIEYWVCGGCGRCLVAEVNGKEEIEEEDTVIKAPGHSEGDAERENEVSPTCEKNGSHNMVIRCMICDEETYRATGITDPALGHDWGAWVVTREASETEEGLETRTCARCDKTESRAIQKLDPSKPTYRNVEGSSTWTKGSAEGLTFTFKRSVDDATTFSHFQGVRVDGADVAASEYDAVSGSVVITMHPSFLETLEVGDHTISALFDDGDPAAATFAVKAASGSAEDTASTKASSSNSSKVTRTSDALSFALPLTLALVAAAAGAIALFARKKSH